MNIYAQFITDDKLSSEGPWMYVEDTVSGAPLFRIKVSQSGGNNARFFDADRDEVFKLSKTHDLLLSSGDKKAAKEFNMNKVLPATIKSYIPTIVTGWETYDAEKREYVPGMQTLEGKVVKFSSDEAVKIMLAVHDLFLEVQGFSLNKANYSQAAALDEDMVKN